MVCRGAGGGSARTRPEQGSATGPRESKVSSSVKLLYAHAGVRLGLSDCCLTRRARHPRRRPAQADRPRGTAPPARRADPRGPRRTPRTPEPRHPVHPALGPRRRGHPGHGPPHIHTGVCHDRRSLRAHRRGRGRRDDPRQLCARRTATAGVPQRIRQASSHSAPHGAAADSHNRRGPTPSPARVSPGFSSAHAFIDRHPQPIHPVSSASSRSMVCRRSSSRRFQPRDARCHSW